MQGPPQHLLEVGGSWSLPLSYRGSNSCSSRLPRGPPTATSFLVIPAGEGVCYLWSLDDAPPSAGGGGVLTDTHNKSVHQSSLWFQSRDSHCPFPIVTRQKMYPQMGLVPWRKDKTEFRRMGIYRWSHNLLYYWGKIALALGILLLQVIVSGVEFLCFLDANTSAPIDILHTVYTFRLLNRHKQITVFVKHWVAGTNIFFQTGEGAETQLFPKANASNCFEANSPKWLYVKGPWHSKRCSHWPSTAMPKVFPQS